jgi:molecular chaperone DnaK
LVGIPPAPRGIPQIEVTFDIDANGIVNVSAKDLGTGKEQKITITASSGLSKEEVERMMKDAESHAEDDKKRREEIETRNKADQAVYAAEKMLQEMGDKLTPSDKAAVENAVEGLKKAIADNDVAAINRAMDLLTQMQHKAAEALYKNTGAGAAGSEGSPGSAGSAGSSGSEAPRGSAGSPDGGDVIDAEVVDDK